MANILFSFADLSAKDKASKELVKTFKKAGAEVATVEVDSKIRRSSGISYRELALVFKDGQAVVMRIKESGDIFQVLLNKKILQVSSQDDHSKAVVEIVQALDAGRDRFQKALAKAKVDLPASVRTAAPKMEVALTEKRDSLVTAIAEARQQAADIRKAAGIQQ